jgi:hypothetical protein
MERVEPVFFSDPKMAAMKALGILFSSSCPMQSSS